MCKKYWQTQYCNIKNDKRVVICLSDMLLQIMTSSSYDPTYTCTCMYTCLSIYICIFLYVSKWECRCNFLKNQQPFYNYVCTRLFQISGWSFFYYKKCSMYTKGHIHTLAVDVTAKSYAKISLYLLDKFNIFSSINCLLQYLWIQLYN